MASANTIMKSAQHRDLIAERENVIGLEMEGVGVWDLLPFCLIIKGVCDYADAHKNKDWQQYAAAAAASATKAILQGFFEEAAPREPQSKPGTASSKQSITNELPMGDFYYLLYIC